MSLQMVYLDSQERMNLQMVYFDSPELRSLRRFITPVRGLRSTLRRQLSFIGSELSQDSPTRRQALDTGQINKACSNAHDAGLRLYL